MNEQQMRRRIIKEYRQGRITDFDMTAAIILLNVNGVESAAEWMGYVGKRDEQRERITQDAPLFAEVTS